MPREEVVPCIPAAEADYEVLGGQPEGPQAVNQQRNQLGVRRRSSFPDDVGIELKMLAEPAFLLAFVAKELGDTEPFERFLVTPLVRGDHAGQSRRHFRPERYFAFAFVDEV